MFDRLFLSHPRSVGETWAEHAVMATRFGLAMLAGGLACLLHALVPGLCVRTGSRTIERLHHAMVANRRRLRPGEDPHLHGHYFLDHGWGI
jgi:hypothetical protein